MSAEKNSGMDDLAVHFDIPEEHFQTDGLWCMPELPPVDDGTADVDSGNDHSSGWVLPTSNGGSFGAGDAIAMMESFALREGVSFNPFAEEQSAMAPEGAATMEACMLPGGDDLLLRIAAYEIATRGKK